MVALEQRHRIGIGLNAPRMAWHQEFHELLGVAIALVALDDHFVDILVIEIADRTLDEVAVLIDNRGGSGSEGFFADFIPEARKIIEIAADFDFGALQPRRAHNAAHRFGQVEFGHDDLQPLAIRAVRNLAADPAAMRRVGHEHAIAPRE